MRRMAASGTTPDSIEARAPGRGPATLFAAVPADRPGAVRRNRVNMIVSRCDMRQPSSRGSSMTAVPIAALPKQMNPAASQASLRNSSVPMPAASVIGRPPTGRHARQGMKSREADRFRQFPYAPVQHSGRALISRLALPAQSGPPPEPGCGCAPVPVTGQWYKLLQAAVRSDPIRIRIASRSRSRPRRGP